MWVEKLFSGVLRVSTPLGPRYLNPSLSQRIQLIWIFRHFQTLPIKVLSPRQRLMVESMCVNNQFIPRAGRFDDVPILGTLEQRPQAPDIVQRRQAANAVRDSVAHLAADIQR
ncbi:MAG: hypothetical protein J2P13_11640 [Acidobacteria bacterium]|nr:hypothetical protein [Acidobacteriota bacterium]